MSILKSTHTGLNVPFTQNNLHVVGYSFVGFMPMSYMMDLNISHIYSNTMYWINKQNNTIIVKVGKVQFETENPWRIYKTDTDNRTYGVLTFGETTLQDIIDFPNSIGTFIW